MDILNLAAYRFVPLDGLPALRTGLRSAAQARALKGTILLAPEGINLFLAGPQAKAREFLEWLALDPRFAGLAVKESLSGEIPFNRLLVKVKQEIIPFGQPGIDPAHAPAPRLSAIELKRWLDEGRPVTLLDTRNAFEVQVGSFEGAVDLGLTHFRDLPAAAARLDPALREVPVVTFCTGGIRCEKAAPWLRQAGFRDVWQLDGGILGYFEACGGAHFRGECFVFDKRVALDAQLQQATTRQCYVCQSVLSPADQVHPDYRPDVACPHCAGRTREAGAGADSALQP